MEMYTPMDPNQLTWNQKNKALWALFFITEKHNGDIKARNVSRVDKQRTFNGYVKFNASSPVVSMDRVIITTAIDAYEGCNVVIMDIPGTFLNIENNEFVLMLLQGKLAELMVQLYP